MRLVRWFGYSIAAVVLLIGLFLGGLYARVAMANNPPSRVGVAHTMRAGTCRMVCIKR
jgi:hypothetical protein